MSESIQLTDAAKYYDEEAHQIRAWEYLQKKVPASFISPEHFVRAAISTALQALRVHACDV